MFKDFTLDSKETNSLVQSTYGTRSSDNIEDIIIKGPLKYARCYEEALQKNVFGAFLIITGKQYIFAKCCDDGVQGHLLSVTKTFLELEGKNNDVSIIEASRIYPKYSKKFLIFDLELKKDQFRRRIEKVFRTTLNHSTISKEEFELFKMFYDEYKEVINKSGFNYSVWDKETGKNFTFKNIDQLCNYLYAISDEVVKPNELENGEKIVGIPLYSQE